MKKTAFKIITAALMISMLFSVAASVAPVFAEPSAYLLGDIDGNGKVTSDDAVYLLRHTLFPEAYPLSDFADFDHNEKITSDDAVYLLRHTLFPDAYPLTGGTDALPQPQNRIAFPEMEYIYNNGAGHAAIGEYLRQAFGSVGISMTLGALDWNSFLGARSSGEYCFARDGWLADYNDPITFLDMWTSVSGNNDAHLGRGEHASLEMYSINLTPYGYDDMVENGTWADTYDVLISRIKSCADAENRYKMMHLAENMLMDTGCIVPLYYYTDLYMISDSVNGFFANPLGTKYFKYCDVDGKTDSISVCVASEPESIDPAYNATVDGSTLITHLFAGLAKWDLDDTGKLVIVPDAAESLPEGVVNPDGTVTYTYKLRKDMKWSNGDDVKASDFVNAWNRAADPAADTAYGYMFEIVDGYAEMWDDSEAKLNATADDEAGTITVTIISAASYWNELLAFPTYFPVHSSVYENGAWATDPATYICNGAYVIDSWDHNGMITLKKNPAYHGADGIKMEEIRFDLSKDSAGMLAAFESGELQFIDDFAGDLAEIRKNHPTELVTAGQLGTYYACFNVNYDMLPGSGLSYAEKEKAQQAIRFALSLLIDRNYLVEEITKGGQAPASSFVAMGMTDFDGSQFYLNAGYNAYAGYYDVSASAYGSNVAKAVAILEQYYNDIK